MKTYRIEVYGRVQGVFLRRNVKRYADSHKLKGNVENQSDGSVLINVQCTVEGLRSFIKWLESSPGVSKVERAEMEVVKSEEFLDFQIIWEGNLIADKGKAVKNLGKGILKL
ncbi:MAG: acylphosphatase [Nanoarchaeota archaeon]